MFINGLKFACQTCVKGHRSSTCNHIERPLLEIRKKGRPVTQCSFCRDLRKTKQVHIKCTCKSKNIENTTSQNHHCCPTTEGGGHSYPDLINEFYKDNDVSTSTALSKPVEEHTFQKSRSSSTLRFLDSQSKSPRKKVSMSRKSSTSSKRSTNIQPFIQQHIAELDSEIMPIPTDFVNNDLVAMTDPDELVNLLNNIWTNKEETNMARSTTTSSTSSASLPQGESVVITITPLSSSQPPFTRIVTCYCGTSCTCLGCFVHPTNYDKLLAPTNNQIIAVPSDDE